jgi:hypothetical protein
MFCAATLTFGDEFSASTSIIGMLWSYGKLPTGVSLL